MRQASHFSGEIKLKETIKTSCCDESSQWGSYLNIQILLTIYYCLLYQIQGWSSILMLIITSIYKQLRPASKF